MSSQAFRGLVVAAVLLSPLLSAGASSHTEVKAVDVKQVQGTWRGKQTDRFGTGEVEWVVGGGEVAVSVRHADRSYTANGTLSVWKGQFFWNAPRSRGEVLLYEADGKRWLKYSLMGTTSGVPIVGEVQEVK
ncbi:MAG: hypothetical protein Q7W02_16815 [Candidatus Rokubacteria bacterium]|nr:hypothetical protein [Candidatus Rokubacteria bacterium]